MAGGGKWPIPPNGREIDCSAVEQTVSIGAEDELTHPGTSFVSSGEAGEESIAPVSRQTADSSPFSPGFRYFFCSFSM
jgi:hypothetical protein